MEASARRTRGVAKALALTRVPCPTCLPLAQKGRIRMETIQRLPPGAYAPLSRKYKGVKICYDCASAEAMVGIPACGTPLFIMARIAIGNDRQEQYRLPGVLMGLVKAGYCRPSKPGDLERQHKWLDENNWFGADDREED
jgi:hypothetical protein